MAVQVSYPGVYIEEFTPGAPIQGVGTSTAAFIGVATRGDLDTPTKVTSWDQFVRLFGDQPVPGSFLWYSVRGFFENGGQVCYVVRASNGKYDRAGYEIPPTTALKNDAGNPMIRLRARRPGKLSPTIKVSVKAAHLVPDTTKLFRPSGPFAVQRPRSIEITGADAVKTAARFRPGDIIDIGGGNPPLTILQVTGAILRVDGNIGTAVGTTVRLANLPAGARTVRLLPSAPLEQGALVPGTVLTISQGGTTDTQVVESVQNEMLTLANLQTYRVTFREGLRNNFDMSKDATVQSEEFTFTVAQDTISTDYPNLSVDPAHPRYYVDILNGPDSLIVMEPIEPPPPALLPKALPDAPASVELKGGEDENLATIGDQDYRDALDTLRSVDDVNLVAVPDRQSDAVQQAVIDHCQLLADRFAVLDSRPGLEPFGQTGSIELQRRALDSTRGYAALYYPWLRVPRAGLGPPVLVPPSGHVCGIIARSDNLRGVHKAPANEIVSGAVGVERSMSDIDQGQLNLQGINVIRVFASGARPVLWGARTTATDRNWQYVNIRRLFLFLEESIQEGIRWAVFEPNNLALWQKLRRTITEFLTRAWRDGALFGATAEEAFYVRIDEILNPFSEQALGRLNIEVGLRPTYPAEFIVVRIGIWPGGSEVSE